MLSRIRPIPPSLARALTAHEQEAFTRGYAKPSDFVFASETGSALNHRNITRRGLEKGRRTFRRSDGMTFDTSQPLR